MKLFFILILVFLIIPQKAFAQSSYVLPYPSDMPGSKFYKVNQVKDKILEYWYFGDFGKFKYNLKQSDKYLVEAKTLFEYKQYLLGYNALKKSNLYFSQLNEILAETDLSKNITQEKAIMKEASEKHREVLLKMKEELPEEYLWQPENEVDFEIDFNSLIDESLKTRNE